MGSPNLHRALSPSSIGVLRQALQPQKNPTWDAGEATLKESKRLKIFGICIETYGIWWNSIEFDEICMEFTGILRGMR